VEVRRYWQPDLANCEEHSEDEWAEIIRDELRAAVRRWTLSDVPVACSLSGGVDSTVITGLLSEMGYPRLRTYSLGFHGKEGSGLNELDLARRVARRWGTDHHELALSPDDLLDDLVPMVWALDEPYGGGLPSWYVFRLMARDVKVGLTGSGGDELFGGYAKWRRYEENGPGSHRSFSQRVKRAVKCMAAKMPSGVISQGRKWRWQEETRPFSHAVETYPLYFSDTCKRTRIMACPTDDLMDTTDLLRKIWEQSGTRDVRNGVAGVDLQTQLPEEFLLMTDRFSMAHSLEARVPYLDHVFAQRMLRIPPHLRTRPGDLKYLLKKALGHLLPAELLSAPKRGFVIPTAAWLRGKLRPLAHFLLGPDRLAGQGLFRPEVYSIWVRPHLTGKANFGDQVWTMLMFELWHLVYIEQAATAAPAFSWQDLVR